LGLESRINEKKNPVFTLVTTILSELSSLEKENLLERQKEGIAQAKKIGTYKGRVKGSNDSKEEVLKKHNNIVKELKLNPFLSLAKIGKICNVSPNTVKKIKELIGFRDQEPETKINLFKYNTICRGRPLCLPEKKETL
jgi:DNA invertase Pin-like site-specific DNA recombinase